MDTGIDGDWRGERTMDEMRADMDRVNNGLVELFVERMHIAQRIGRHKKARGLPVYDPEREAAVLDAMSERAPEELREYVRPFFQCMMDLAKLAEEKEG